MFLLKTKAIGNRYFQALLKLRSPRTCHNNPLLPAPVSSCSSRFVFNSSISLRSLSILAQFSKPVSFFFRRAARAPEKREKIDGQAPDDNNNENAKLKKKLRSSEEEVRSLKEKLRNLEEEIRNLDKKRPEIGKISKRSEKGGLIEREEAKGSLWALFSNKKPKDVKVVEGTDFGHENPTIHKDLSSDMQMFAHHLYMNGYFKNANFISKNKFDSNYFEVSYAREFLKFAAVNFGRDHQEIAKWLSAKDLKTVALSGCPCLGRRSVYAAKQLRSFFGIDEQKVCQKCILKDSCDRANKRSKGDWTKLRLADVTRVVTMYAMDSVPQKLVVRDEVKDSVGRLLKEIVRLTQSTP